VLIGEQSRTSNDRLKKRQEESTRRAREELAEQEVARVTNTYNQAFSLVDKSIKILDAALKLAVASQALASSGEAFRHRLSSRLEIIKSAKFLSSVSSDLSRKVKAARKIETRIPETSEASISKFLSKIDMAASLLSEAEAEIPSFASNTKPPREIRELVHSMAAASLVLGKFSKRLRSRTRITSDAISDSIRSSELEFE
jgi:hypothetical protein